MAGLRAGAASIRFASQVAGYYDPEARLEVEMSQGLITDLDADIWPAIRIPRY